MILRPIKAIIAVVTLLALTNAANSILLGEADDTLRPWESFARADDAKALRRMTKAERRYAFAKSDQVVEMMRAAYLAWATCTEENVKTYSFGDVPLRDIAAMIWIECGHWRRRFARIKTATMSRRRYTEGYTEEFINTFYEDGPESEDGVLLTMKLIQEYRYRGKPDYHPPGPASKFAGEFNDADRKLRDLVEKGGPSRWWWPK